MAEADGTTWWKSLLEAEDCQHSDHSVSQGSTQNIDLTRIVLHFVYWAFLYGFAVLLLSFTSLRWATESTTGVNTGPVIVLLPAGLMVLTHVLLLSVWWLGVHLCSHQRDLFQHVAPAFAWPRKPPDPPTPSGHVRRAQRRPSLKNKLLLMALGAAATHAHDLSGLVLTGPDLQLRAAMMSKCTTAKGVVRSDRIHRLDEDDLNRFRQAVMQVPEGLGTDGDSFQCIIDCGASSSSTGHLSDFLPGTLHDLAKPVRLEGIAGDVSVTKAGKVRYEWLTTTHTVKVVELTAYYVPNMTCRLLSPQAYWDEIADDDGSFQVRRRKSVMQWGDGTIVDIPYHPTTNLPIIRTYSNALDTAQALAMKGCVSDEVNQNLTAKAKLLLKNHFRLGHVNFSTVQWIGRQGWLGKQGESMGHGTIEYPKCAACLYGKQHRSSIPNRHVKRSKDGELLKNKLHPGDLIFSDQYLSSTPGRTPSSRGTSQSQYSGGTLFYDAASGSVHCYHQLGMTASETIESKIAFERMAQGCGVAVKDYHTDNGIYTSKEFMRELNEAGQGLTLSGVDAQFQNGAAENAIKIVVRMARTMMLHATLRWPEVADKALWPLAMSHAVHLYNHTPHRDSGVSPMELWTRTMSDHSALANSHPWGCPVYVLDPKLRGGQKIPKWSPRSKRGQYMGASPLHASTVGLVQNLQTGSITPQFHVVYDDFFETVHSGPDQEPPAWEHLVTFERFRNELDPDDDTALSDDWLSPEELHDRRQQQAEHNGPRQQEGTIISDVDDPAPIDASANGTPVREKRAQPQRERTPRPTPPMDPVREPVVRPTSSPSTPIRSPTTAPPPAPPSAPRVRSAQPEETTRCGRKRKPPSRYGYDGTGIAGYLNMRRTMNCCMLLGGALTGAQRVPEHDFRYITALAFDSEWAALDDLHPGIGQFPQALKASKTSDPDLPSLHEARRGEHWDAFKSAMDKEINQLEEHGTWHWVERKSLAHGTNVLPTTWVLRIKRYPDGRLNKFKARLCARGDKQVAGVDYFDTYSPVVSWSTVRLMLCLAAHQNLATRQIDFSNAFVQATLREDVYIEVPDGYGSPDYAKGELVLKLDKSQYGLCQAPSYWANFLKAALEKRGLQASEHDPCLYYGKGVICLTYVDDCLWFAKRQDDIDAIIADLKKDLTLTVEDTGEDAFSFLGVEVKTHENGEVELLQTGLIDKVLKLCGVDDGYNSKKTPCVTEPLGTNPQGEPCKAEWGYASAVGMLMYLCSNSRPDIQFAVHQCARFTHCPKHTHEEAIIRICRYLLGTRDKGLRFKPGKVLELDCYVDADFAGLYNVEAHDDPVCVKSRTGYVLTLGSCPLLWVSKLQTEITLSTTEAEYVALSQSMRDLLPMRAKLQDVLTHLNIGPKDSKSKVVSTVFEDNNGCMALATSPKINPRTKHIAVKYHHFRGSVGEGTGITVEKIETNEQKADIFTKGLVQVKFEYLRKKLMGW